MKVLKKADVLLIIAILIFGLIVGLLFTLDKSQGKEIIITADSKTFGTYDIFASEDIIIENDGQTNHIRIENGNVFMKDANCRGQDCVHQGEKSSTGESIVCIPNKVIVEVVGGESEFDGISE